MTLSTAVALKASIVQSMLGSTALPSPADVSDVDAAEALIFASETPPTYLQAKGGESQIFGVIKILYSTNVRMSVCSCDLPVQPLNEVTDHTDG
jgi:hypothetical protein